MDDTLRRAAEGDGSAAYDLLQQFFKGRKLEDLLWLADQGEEGARQAAWLSTELPDASRVMFPRLRWMLTHADSVVRCWGTECALLWATASDPEVLQLAARTILDPSESVQYFGLQFLVRVSDEQLAALFSWSKDDELGEGLELLARALADEAALLDHLEDDWPMAAFAAAAAVRWYDRMPAALRRMELHPHSLIHTTVSEYRKHYDRRTLSALRRHPKK